MKKALAGDLETLLLELLMPPLEYEAYRLQQAMVVCGCLCFMHVLWDWSLCLYVCWHESLEGEARI